MLWILISIARRTVVALTGKFGATGSRRPGGTMVTVFFFFDGVLLYSSVLCLHVVCESSRVEEVLGHWTMGLQLSNLNKGFSI
jgi:hypothetical protein